MDRDDAAERSNRLLDLAGLALIALAVLVCGGLALAGSYLAWRALPLLAGALFGDGAVFLAIRFPRSRKPLVTLALLVVISALFVRAVVSTDLFAYRLFDSPLWLPWEVASIVEKFAVGVIVGFGGAAVSQVLLPGLDASGTWEEAVGQRRELVRGAIVIVGILLVFLVLAVVIFGVLALIVYTVATFSS